MTAPDEAQALPRVAAVGRTHAVTRVRTVVFSYDPSLAEAGSEAQYAARLLERAVSYVDAIDLDGLLASHDAAPASELAKHLLDAVRLSMSRRLGLDFATTLLPRLTEKRTST